MEENAPGGIEATDLASLLHRFEEATSSADDLHIPIQKKKKDLIMRAKSAGNSPGPTPPGTPPPNVNHMIIKRKPARTPSNSRTSFTAIPSQIVTPLSNQPKSESSSTSAFIPLANKIMMVPLQIHPLALGTTSGSSAQMLNRKPSNTSLKSLLQSNQVIYLRHAGQLGGTQTVQGVSQTSASLQRLPASSAIPLIIPNRNSPLVTSTSTVVSTTQTSSTAGAFQVAVTSTSCHTSQQFALSPAVPLLSHNPTVVPKLACDQSSGSQVLQNIDANVPQKSFSCIENLKWKPDVPSDSVKDEPMDGCDHTYCSNMNEEFQQNNAAVDSESSSANSSQQLSVINLDPCETQPRPDESKATSVINSVKMYPDVLTEGSEPLLDSSNDQKLSSYPNEFVFEEGEVLVDADGNDSLPQHVTWSLDAEDSEEGEPDSGRVVTFRSAEKDVARKRLRRYRQPAEFSTSPVREDTAGFFDKIPSYYTALSIPSKPVTTSVFASATKTIGSTDHLDLLDTSQSYDDEGHYDKVPAHRRLFTNTTKDVEIEISKEDFSSAYSDQPSSSRMDPADSDYSSTATHSHRRNSRKSSTSSATERRSRSTSRRSRSASRYSGRSASSGSQCSTCSYRSRSYSCSTCSGSSRSRSRSPSCSESEVDSSTSEYMKSRSRSPGACRDWKLRGKRSRHRSTPDRQGTSRSRTRSPAERAGWRSHTHRRRRHSSSTDAKVLERRKAREEEKIKAMEERRVVYVGKIPDGYTKKQLHERFACFGEIKEVKVNFREHGDNYGFVTFAYACDAIAAKEKGNNVPGAKKFDLCFGGRRRFCPDEYADLDGNREIEEEYAPMPKNLTEELDYAALLRQHSNQQKRRTPR